MRLDLINCRLGCCGRFELVRIHKRLDNRLRHDRLADVYLTNVALHHADKSGRNVESIALPVHLKKIMIEPILTRSQYRQLWPLESPRRIIAKSEEIRSIQILLNLSGRPFRRHVGVERLAIPSHNEAILTFRNRDDRILLKVIQHPHQRNEVESGPKNLGLRSLLSG